MNVSLILFGHQLELDASLIPDPWPGQADSQCWEKSSAGFVCTSPDAVPHSLHIASGNRSVAEIWATPERQLCPCMEFATEQRAQEGWCDCGHRYAAHAAGGVCTAREPVTA